MEYQAIVVHDDGSGSDQKEDEPTISTQAKEKHKAGEPSPPPTVNQTIYENRATTEYQPSEAEETFETQHQEYWNSEEEEEYTEASFQVSLSLIKRQLEERRQLLREEGSLNSSSITIFKLPNTLVGINEKAQEPETVSIGPYHRGKDHLLKFEDHKWFFLDKLLDRVSDFGKYLSHPLRRMTEMEARTRECYSDAVLMSSHDFVEMMLLDSCFVIELLRHLGHSKEVIDNDDPIFTRPWLIPILLRDLLKLENQLPFFVIESLFLWSKTRLDKADDLPLLALKVFDLAFPRSLDTLYKHARYPAKHLLDLFYHSLIPQDADTKPQEQEEYRPSTHSIQCAAQLRPSTIKFKATQTESFLEIDFKRPVLEIPAITINDFTSTVIINCVALEQCLENNSSKYFNEYVSFMSCLINQPRDVSFLCSDGIITGSSQDDQCVANLFNNLGKNVVFNIRSCYLSKQYREVEAYYSSNWATMMRTYFSSPWSFISVFSAFILIVLTMVQTIMSILSYKLQLN